MKWLRAVLVALVSMIGMAAFGGEIEFTFTSTYDGTRQQAAAYVPGAVKDGKPVPLLVVAHCLGGNRFVARGLGYYEEAEQRGWLVVTPELHGRRMPGTSSFAAPEAQHDILDAIAYMQATYPVDASRIFLTGRSMGGMLAEVMAAKHPDLFAAVVAGQGISDLKSWIEQSPQFPEEVAKECGAYVPANAFEYQRRSALSYAPNLQYVPLILWHGTNDTWVRPEQSEALHAAMAKQNRFLPPVHWLLNAAHCPLNYPASWECEQIRYYQNACEGGMGLSTRFYPSLSLVTDEAGSIFWLHIVPRDGNRFARVEASLRDGALTIRTENVSALSVDRAKIAQGVPLTRYAVKSDAPLTLRVCRGEKTLFSVTTQGGNGAVPDSAK